MALGRPASRRVGRVRGIRARRRQRASKGGLKKPASGGIRAGPPARRAAPLESALIRAGSRRFGPGRLVSRCAGHVGHTRTASARASKGGAEKPGSGGIRAGPPARRAAPLESALIRAGSRRFGPWKAGVSSGPTIRLFIGDLHRSTTEVSRRLHVEALSNNALLWRKTFLLNASYRLRLSINRNMCRRRCRCWRSAWSSRPLGCRRRIKGRQLRGPT